ncbi:MAG: cation:dicarboxylase symporter family transporter [Candidatus Paracaedibacteraceae bacterium]|nr:cation:dicarboxylase symporter family transporter [Candidatus Paracaedibacteraceae bacterium]
MNIFKSLPAQLVICVIAAYLAADFATPTHASYAYSLSCVLKDFLMMLLPFVIISYMGSAILSLEQKAPLLIIAVLTLVCVSNMLATFVSYGVSLAALPFVTQGKMIQLSGATETINSLLSTPFPVLLEPKWAMIVGSVYGLTLSIRPYEPGRQIIFKLRDLVTKILQKSFIPLLPVYVFGFVLKMQMEGSLSILFQSGGQIIALMISLIVIYIGLMYAIAANFVPNRFATYIRNMFPAAFTGFTTMSSAATMPVTLDATEKNMNDKSYSQLVIPATVNIHLVGDALGIPLLGLATLQLSGLPMPDLPSFAIFAGFFCVAKFSTAGIPGGGILVLLPTLQSHLGLTEEMLGFVTTLYILQDSIFTGSNVAGNGAFALLSHKIMKALGLVGNVKQQEDVQLEAA